MKYGNFGHFDLEGGGGYGENSAYDKLLLDWLIVYLLIRTKQGQTGWIRV